ncbi:alpha/beta fold hydrolase [Microbispora bryophytorum]|uniref:Hydrolase n=1 Tax=Microbispora bryophytorum TaxID=1460882 RepID=A0A8H9GV74_9ACTN|nr:alpha/beta fold hydrolase [Microbispora bryophytorum]MBD3139678.1 alpha/beta fold hydrolase [Microbispora bryophytorum]TQS02960.1 alpha/beta hydrolase [Microbispora bryophytorum]GGO03272.1 hydrolase [Microbispora bryophytorum]
MELAHDRRGSGPPLILLHGIGHHRRGWLPVLDLLAERHDVIAVDLPGFGDSPPLPYGTPYNVETLGRAVRDFWIGLGLNRPHVAGNSLGGYIALDLASSGDVRTAVALSPAGFWSRAEHAYSRAVLRLLRLAAQADGLPAFAAGTDGGKALALGLLVARPERLPREAVLAAATALRECVGFEETLDSLAWAAPPAPPQVPVTIAWGDRDRLLPRRQAVRAARWAGQRTLLLRGCGHVPMSDDPELVARVILGGSILEGGEDPR